MANRQKISKKRSRKDFKKNSHSHKLNFKAVPARGGFGI